MNNKDKKMKNETKNAVLAETILYILKDGALPRNKINDYVQEKHFEFLDYESDRICKGVKKGKLWRHYVGAAIEHLKRKGLVKQINDGKKKWILS